MPEDSFRLVIAGPSGSGKTNTLLHMIYNLLFFDEILLFAKNLHQINISFSCKTLRKELTQKWETKLLKRHQKLSP